MENPKTDILQASKRFAEACIETLLTNEKFLEVCETIKSISDTVTADVATNEDSCCSDEGDVCSNCVQESCTDECEVETPEPVEETPEPIIEETSNFIPTSPATEPVEHKSFNPRDDLRKNVREVWTPDLNTHTTFATTPIARPSVNEQREQIISVALESPEGRTALAAAMVEPIKTSLMYQGLARKLLMVDELPQGALARYNRTDGAKSYILDKRGNSPRCIEDAEELLVPLFELASNPTIKLSEIRQRRYYIVDRAQVRAKDSLQRQEDIECFKLLKASVPQDHVVKVESGKALCPDDFSLAMTMIEEHDIIAAKVIMHPNIYRYIRFGWKDIFDEACTRDILMTGLYGHIGSADIHVSTLCPKNTIFVLAPFQFVGVMPIRQDITVLPADDPRRLRLGWVVYEEIGMSVINDYSISKIVIGDESESQYWGDEQKLVQQPYNVMSQSNEYTKPSINVTLESILEKLNTLIDLQLKSK